MKNQNNSTENNSKFLGDIKSSQKSVTDSAYGEYETLKSILVDEEALGGIKLEEVKITTTDSLIAASEGNGRVIYYIRCLSKTYIDWIVNSSHSNFLYNSHHALYGNISINALFK